jgi:hypothetical protein
MHLDCLRHAPACRCRRGGGAPHRRREEALGTMNWRMLRQEHRRSSVRSSREPRSAGHARRRMTPPPPTDEAGARPAEPPDGYARRVGLFSGVMLVIGGIIGSGIFLNPAIVAQRVHTPGLPLACGCSEAGWRSSGPSSTGSWVSAFRRREAYPQRASCGGPRAAARGAGVSGSFRGWRMRRRAAPAGGGWEYPAFLVLALGAQALLGDGAWTLRPASGLQAARASEGERP